MRRIITLFSSGRQKTGDKLENIYIETNEGKTSKSLPGCGGGRQGSSGNLLRPDYIMLFMSLMAICAISAVLLPIADYKKAALYVLVLLMLFSVRRIAKNLTDVIKGKTGTAGIGAVLCLINTMVLIAKSPYASPYYDHLLILTAALLYMPQALALVISKIRDDCKRPLTYSADTKTADEDAGLKLCKSAGQNGSENDVNIYYVIAFLTVAAAFLLTGLSQGTDGLLLMCIISAGAVATAGQEYLAVCKDLFCQKDAGENMIFFTSPKRVLAALENRVAAVRHSQICQTAVSEAIPITVSRRHALYYCAKLFSDSSYYKDIHSLNGQLMKLHASDNDGENIYGKKALKIHSSSMQSSALIGGIKVSAYTLLAKGIQNLLVDKKLPEDLKKMSATEAVQIKEFCKNYPQYADEESITAVFCDDKIAAVIVQRLSTDNFAAKLHAGGQNYIILSESREEQAKTCCHYGQSYGLQESALREFTKKLPRGISITMYAKSGNGAWVLAQNRADGKGIAAAKHKRAAKAQRQTAGGAYGSAAGQESGHDCGKKSGTAGSVFTPIAYIRQSLYGQAYSICKNLTITQNKNIFWAFIYNISVVLLFIAAKDYYMFAPILSVIASTAAAVHFAAGKNVK